MNVDYGQRRDRWLEATVRGLLEHDDRLSGLDVDVRFDGGVAHVHGHADTHEQRLRLRETIGALRGVHAVWDAIRTGDQQRLRIVDLGAGATKQLDPSYGLDLFALPGVDVVTDFRHGLPLRDASVDRVMAVHVLEHLVDVVQSMNELHRVLAPRGVLHVLSPDWRSVNAVADPTHVKLFDVQTFKYFCGPHPGMAVWYPLHVGYDGASVFADLTPLGAGDEPADTDRLARFFD